MIFGVKNAGKLGPMTIFFTPKWSRVNKITTAFYSTQESTKWRGRSFTPHFRISAKAKATFTAE